MPVASVPARLTLQVQFRTEKNGSQPPPAKNAPKYDVLPRPGNDSERSPNSWVLGSDGTIPKYLRRSCLTPGCPANCVGGGLVDINSAGKDPGLLAHVGYYEQHKKMYLSSQPPLPSADVLSAEVLDRYKKTIVGRVRAFKTYSISYLDFQIVLPAHYDGNEEPRTVHVRRIGILGYYENEQDQCLQPDHHSVLLEL